MAVKRVVDVYFWDDYRILDELSIEDRYFYLFLLTNPHATQVGIYQLPLRTIAHKTGFGREVVLTLLDRFEKGLGLIKYNYQTQEVTVLESLRYSIIKGGPQVISLMEKELNRIKDTQLIEATLEYNEQYFDVSSRVFYRSLKELLLKEINRRQEFEKPVQKSEFSVQNFDSSHAVEEEQTIQKQNFEPSENRRATRRKLQIFDVNNLFDSKGFGQAKEAEEELAETFKRELRPFSFQLFEPQSRQQDEDENEDEDENINEDENEDEEQEQKIEQTIPFTHSSFTTTDQSFFEENEAAEVEETANDELKDFNDFCHRHHLSFSNTQLKSYREWLEKLPIEVIIESVRRSLTKSHIFSYSMKILWNWYEEGLTTMGSIKKAERKPKRKKAVATHEEAVIERLNNPTDYTGEEVDEEELKRREAALRQKLKDLLEP